jgi:uncharacterized protein YndB with AHSA1/START domain
MSNRLEDNNNNKIIKTTVVDATPKTVFNAIVDERQLPQWAPANQRAIFEQKVGGIVQFETFTYDTQNTYVIRGKVLELIPEKKISYTWKVDAPSKYP